MAKAIERRFAVTHLRQLRTLRTPSAFDLLLVCKHCPQSKRYHCGRPYRMRHLRYLDRMLNQLDQSLSEQAYPDRTETESENDHCYRPDRMADRRLQLQVRQ